MARDDRGAPAILIVDDDDYVHGAVTAVLRRYPADVTRATTAADGLRLARDTRPQLAIVDVGLPDGDGYAVARSLKSDADGPPPKVLILTGHAPDPDAATAAGADAVMAKPFRLHEFLATVERLLGVPATRSERPSGRVPREASGAG